MREQQAGRFVGNTFYAALELAVVMLDEESCQPQNVFPALSQGRNDDLNHVEAEVQILAESPLLHRFTEVLVGGGDHAQIELDVFQAAQPAERLFFEHAQHLGLQHQRNFADFIQE